MGRAMGETIAVAMVIGNNYSLPHSLLAPGATLGSAIINNFGEAASRARPQLGHRPRGGVARHHRPRQRRRSAPVAAPDASHGGGGVSSDRLPRRPRQRRRCHRDAARPRAASRPGAPWCGAGSWGEGPSCCASWRWPSRWRLWSPSSPTPPAGASTPCRGAFFTHAPTPPGIPGGGISNAIVGSVIIIGLAAAMAVPVGTMCRPVPRRAPGSCRRRAALRGRRAHRGAVDRAGDLRLRRARRRPSASYSGLVGELRAGRAHAAHRDPRQRGRHAIGATRPVGGGPGPRGAARRAWCARWCCGAPCPGS